MTRTAADSPVLPPRALVGMVHVAALPGSPRASLDLPSIARQAVAEARVLADAGFDAIMIENMHDRPYIDRHGPHVVAAMTRVAVEIRAELPRARLGVQVLSSGEHEALAIAQAADAQFIRCENFVFAHVADEGLMAQAKAGPLLRYRREIGAQHIHVFCDIKKKHASHAITEDISIADSAHAAEFFGADALVVTGPATGMPTEPGDIAQARAASTLPILVGSGATPDSIRRLFDSGADALIVGSAIKKGGVWTGPVDPHRSAAMVRARS